MASSNPVDGVQLYDAETFDPVAFDDDTPSSIIRFSPDGRVLAAAVNHWTASGQERIVPQPVRLYDLPEMRLSDRQLGGWPVGSSVDYSLDFSRDGHRIAAVANRWDDEANDWRKNGAVMVWDVRRPEVPVFEVAVADPAVAALSPDGRRVYTATEVSNSSSMYDVSSGRLLRSTASSEPRTWPSARTGRRWPSVRGAASSCSTRRAWPSGDRCSAAVASSTT